MTVTDASGGQVLGDRRGPRHAAARRVPDGPGPLGRVRRHSARPRTAGPCCGRTRRNPFSVSDGNLNLPIANGSMYGAGTSAKNLIVQDAPDGAVDGDGEDLAPARSTRTTTRPACACGRDDNNWASVHMISRGRQPRLRVHLRGRRQPAQRGRPTSSAASRRTRRSTYYVRIVSDGDEPDRVLLLRRQRRSCRVGRPAPLATFGDDRRSARRRCRTWRRRVPMARFDWIRFDPDGSGGGGDETRRRLRRHDARRGLGRVIRGDQSVGRQRRHAARSRRSRATSTRPATTPRT